MNDLKNLQVVEVKGIRVLTSKQLSDCYGTTPDTIKTNFNANRKRFQEGKHYIAFTGEELKAFKDKVRNPHLVGNRASRLYLWTEKGALLHAKSLNTDKAWEVYDYLVDFYFHTKEEAKPVPETKTTARPFTLTVVDVPENPRILNVIQKLEDDAVCMQVLLNACKEYVSEETYKERRRAAAEVVQIIVNDMNRWLDLQPKLIQKQY